MEKLKERYANEKRNSIKKSLIYTAQRRQPARAAACRCATVPGLHRLYNALSTPVELRHAPFLWIHDLSRPD